MTELRWIAVPDADGIAPGEIIGVEIEGLSIAIYLLEDGSLHATDNLCTHGQAYLSEGWIVDGCKVECPLHAGCFDIRSGRAEGPPADIDLQTYPVRRGAEGVELAIPSGSG